MRIPVDTQENVRTSPYRRGTVKRKYVTVPNTGGDGNITLTVPSGYQWRVLAFQGFAQYDSVTDNDQYVTYGIDAMTTEGLQNVLSLYDMEYLAPSTIYRFNAFYGADTSFRDVPTAAGVTQRSLTRPIPDWWIPEQSRVYIGFHNFVANDDGQFAIIYEEIRYDV